MTLKFNDPWLQQKGYKLEEQQLQCSCNSVSDNHADFHDFGNFELVYNFDDSDNPADFDILLAGNDIGAEIKSQTSTITFNLNNKIQT